MRGTVFAVILSAAIGTLFLGAPLFVALAQTTIDANSLVQKASITFSPRTGTFQEASSFEVPVYIDTRGKSVNTIELHIKFDPKKLQVTSPAGRNSIITLWVEPPSYSNTDGTIKFVGVVPGGINTSSGLIATITFKALAAGDTRISITSDSTVLANDGAGTNVRTDFGTALYTIVPIPPEGVRVFSDTHPNQDVWYNNPSPVLQWEKPEGITDFSYLIDDKPNTIPDDVAETSDTTLAVSGAKEGVSYFHIKAKKNGVWGGTTTYVLHIDTTPPAAFTPTADMYAAAIASSKVLVSFFTTDTLSGVDHYEVGTINKSDAPDVSPAFLEAQSPYSVPTQNSTQMRVIVRAFDRAGNVRDGYIDITLYPTILRFLQAYALSIILGLVILLILALLSHHYLFKHHVLGNLKRAFRIAKQEEEQESVHSYVEPPVQHASPLPPPPPPPQQSGGSNVHAPDFIDHD